MADPMDQSALVVSPVQYIPARVHQYQKWYDKKAVATKSRYLRMKAFSVIRRGLVPVLINILFRLAVFGMPLIQALVTVISLLVVITVSLEGVFHYREQWKNYRSTEQILGHETFLFRSRVGRYQGLSDQKRLQSIRRTRRRVNRCGELRYL